MTLLTNPPEWNAPGVEPPQTKKDEGWDVGERPPAPWMNWWMNRSYQSLLDLEQAVLGLRMGGPSTERPDNPEPYQMYFDTTLGRPVWWTGSQWVDAQGQNV